MFVLNHAIKLSKFFGKHLYVCAIDASKAFDKVNRDILWSKLMKKNINTAIIVSIINYYKESQMFVMNGVKCSDIFKTTDGVRQGGSLSPKLFAIYLEDLIEQIEENEAGLNAGRIKLDVIAYADDVLLISTTKLELQCQLNIVQEYGLNNCIKYNPSKTVYMVFNSKFKRKSKDSMLDQWEDELELDGSVIRRVPSMRYLGVEISEDDRIAEHLEKRKRLVFQSISRLKTIGLHTHHLHPIMKGQLYKTYIRPILLYGIEAFHLNQGDINGLKRFEGNVVKKLMEISTRCRTRKLFNAMNIETTGHKLDLLKIEFYLRLDQNCLTRVLLKYLETIDIKDDIVSEIYKITNILDFNPGTNTAEACAMKKYMIKDEIRCEREDEQVGVLKKIFDSKDRGSIAKEIFEILKFT